MTLVSLPLLIIAASQSAGSQDIVVVGKLAASESALAQCIAQGCPPGEDVTASLRHAENQFVEGDYDKALTTLRRAKARTREHRDAIPARYADLMRATALVARHLGNERIFREGVLDARKVLADNRAADDPLLLAVTLEAGDMYLRTRHPRTAESTYRAVARRARAKGMAVTEAAALLRLISLYIFQAGTTPLDGFYLRQARAVADEIAEQPDPAFRRFDPVARLMVARLAAKLGDETALDTTIQAYGREIAPMVPVLASVEHPRMNSARMGMGNTVSAATADYSGSNINQNAFDRRPVQNFHGQWLDVSFWIRPDGRVDDIAVLRKSKQLSGGWEVPLLHSIASRRYMPLALDATDSGLFRIERYTYTAPLEKVTGSIIAGRAPAKASIAMVDLSPAVKR